MAPTLRSNKPFLEIIPDTRFIVFNGGEHEAEPVKLSGIVRLTTAESISIVRPHIWLEGRRKISWPSLGSFSTNEIVHKRKFWNKVQMLGELDFAHKTKAGVIEWPFEFDLSPSMPESVEGLKDTYIAYHLHAHVTRPGWGSKDVSVQQHIRIVRTLGPESWETTRSTVKADVWASKLSYRVSIPTDAVVFGTSIIANVELSPIRKGLTLGKVQLELLENVVKQIPENESPELKGDRSHSEEIEVVRTDMDFPEHSKVHHDDTPDDPTMADDMYRFQATLELPKSLHDCRQDVDSHHISVSHLFKLMVNLHNPEGHISRLVCRMPVKLFISPNFPVDESNAVRTTTNGIHPNELNNTEASIVAPPEYGRHQLDQLFNNIDPASFMSRPGSISGTPTAFNAQSPSASQENLSALNNAPNAFSALSHRANGFTSCSRPHSSSFTGDQGNMTSSTLHLRLTSLMNLDEGLVATIQRRQYTMANLVRVPSYDAALRASGSITAFTEVPPSYDEASSGSTSPNDAGETVWSNRGTRRLDSTIPGLHPATAHSSTDPSPPTSSHHDLPADADADAEDLACLPTLRASA